MGISQAELLQELKLRAAGVDQDLNQPHYYRSFQPEPLREAVYSYLKRPAKRLRPGLLRFACGAVGGAESQARLAAAAVEVYHTWTLVHDDIIDNDPQRRGAPTVHEEFRQQAINWGYPAGAAQALGRNLAILTGDLQQAWSLRLLLDSVELGVALPVVLDLARELTTTVTSGLVEGEARDVLLARQPLAELSEAEILRMLELKTGVLFEYAARAGAAIGWGGKADPTDLIGAVGRFARGCGTAFQLQDDLLGLSGNAKLLGKPVGSDLREGKRTLMVLHGFQNGGKRERRLLEQWLGNPRATASQLNQIKQVLLESGGVEYTQSLAVQLAAQAAAELDQLPESRFKELLLAWGSFVVNREL